MNKLELGIKIAGVIMSTAIGVATLIIEHKKTTKISDEDKKDISEKTADEVIRRLSLANF